MKKKKLNNNKRLLIRLHVDHLAFLENEIHTIDEAIAKQIRDHGWHPHQELLTTIPGVGPTSAAAILAEVGPDMSVFGSEKKISAWAGACPGNAVSAGVSGSTRRPQGNAHLKTTLSMCAIAASHTTARPSQSRRSRSSHHPGTRLSRSPIPNPLPRAPTLALPPPQGSPHPPPHPSPRQTWRRC